MNRWQMARYRYPSGWKKVSLTIRCVAGNRCEWCGVPNGTIKPNGTRVILTVAHIGAPFANGAPGDKHDKRDIRRENLRALCQACHLKYDLEDHIQHARETRARKRREAAQASGQLELFT